MSSERAMAVGTNGDAAVRRVLAEQYPDHAVCDRTVLTDELDIDSMGWVELSTALGERTGVWLDDEALSRVRTVADLQIELETATAPGSGGPLTRPDAYLDDDLRGRLARRGLAMDLASRALLATNTGLGRLLFGLRIRGREHLPASGPFVIAPTHMSYLDGIEVAAALPYRRLRTTWFATYSGQAFANPVTTLVTRLAALLPIDGDDAPLASLALGAAVLQRGHTLVWFPSGQRSPDGEVQPLRRGIGALLEHFRVPVVPAVVTGSRRAMPPERNTPRPARIDVLFDRALDVADLERAGAGELARQRITSGLHDHLVRLYEAHR